MMKPIKIFIAGIILGGILVGLFFKIIDLNDSGGKLFSNKDRCTKYIEKRQAVYDSNSSGDFTTVRGFYSPTANTCMTDSEVLGKNYIKSTLLDELTGRVEAATFIVIGEDFNKLSIDDVKNQLAQEKLYDERLAYFQGEK